MKIEAKGYLFWTPTYGREGNFEFMPWDCRDWDEEARCGRIFVKEHTTEIDVPDDFNPMPAQIAALEAEKQKARAEFQQRITEIDRQIQSLLAIEHAEPA